ncbi:AraC family transcriptional regulator [Streptomyces albipurpureus]|uniref:AraC family transcriptional regulator n=1 Tax=Streptomyces albipurpureus TaxID=2897419 RepID=A0ABT0UYN4_9ACTN|nr:AraC family transcriptional regulator [Streptomyces sp. CWNU-1]MCM2393688.1 AraC family transcriptional regulator [Streptomyces sp. CWNU-1]
MGAPPYLGSTNPDQLTRTLKVTGARCVLARGLTAGGAWALRFPAPGRLKVHAVLRGVTWLTVDGDERPVLLETGDVVAFSGGLPYVLAADPSVPPQDALALLGTSPHLSAHAGDEGIIEVLSIGAHFELNTAGEDLLLQVLPPVIHLPRDGQEAPTLCWLLEQVLCEMSSDRPGGNYVTEHLSQLVFAHVLRAYLARSESYPAGWLRALADERIAPALHLMHTDPGRAWQLTELARAAAMSRSAFAGAFTSVAGVPPLTYLHQWRMRLAEQALLDDDTPLSELALSLGYASESAFSHAFKRETGVAPKRFRDAARAPRDRDEVERSVAAAFGGVPQPGGERLQPVNHPSRQRRGQDGS